MIFKMLPCQEGETQIYARVDDDAEHQNRRRFKHYIRHYQNGQINQQSTADLYLVLIQHLCVLQSFY